MLSLYTLGGLTAPILGSLQSCLRQTIPLTSEPTSGKNTGTDRLSLKVTKNNNNNKVNACVSFPHRNE